MTLNDNPRVDAECRYRILSKRWERLRRISGCYVVSDIDYLNHGWAYNKAFWELHKARLKRIENEIYTEITGVKRVLKAFGWNG